MQFTGILPQTAQGGVGSTGLQAQPDRKVPQDEGASGTGFLSWLQGVRPEEAAESTTVDAALPGGAAALDAEGQSLRLALSLAGTLLTGTGSPQSAELRDAPAQAAVLLNTLPSTTPSRLTQETVLLAAVADSTETPGLSIDAEQLTGSGGLAAQQGDGVSQVQTGTNNQTATPFVSRAEELTIDEATLFPQGQQTDGGDQEDVPDISPTKLQEGIETTDREETANQASQVAAASASGTADLASDPVAADRAIVADPVFRLPESRPANASHNDAVRKSDGPLPFDVQDQPGEVSRPPAQFSGLESKPELHFSDQDQQAAFSSGQDTGSNHPTASNAFGGTSAFPTQGHPFAVATNLAGQATGSPMTSRPSTPPVPTIPLSAETPPLPSAPSVQFDLPNTDFGNLRVRVVLSEQTVHTHMVTDRADLGRLLVDRQDYLGAQLSTAGLDLGQLRVQVDRQGSHQQGYESPYRQDGRFHQSAGEQPRDRHAPQSGQPRERAGVLSLFA